MRTAERMSMGSACCLASDNLAHAASLMWQNDCGSLPVVDEGNRVEGMITDRDICMAACVTGKRLVELCVGDSMAREVAAVGLDDSLLSAEMLMRARRVHRLPVVDSDRQLLGMLCSNDLLRWVDDGGASGARPSDAVRLVRTLATIGESRSSVPTIVPIRRIERPGATQRTLEPEVVAAVDGAR